jgi:sulfonate transport system ATP-binding protein
MLELNQVTRRYSVRGRAVAALSDLSLALPAGSLTAVVGRSGCGKTTLLRLIAGLERPDAGALRWDGGASPRVGYVFQEPRLMPWLSVARNVALTAAPGADIAGALAAVGLAAFAEALPAQLSGGMAQRVSVARALAQQAGLILMDEPFSALDAFTRAQLQDDLVSLWQEKRAAILFVTHDIEEACRLAQRIVVLREGRLHATHVIALPYPRDALDPRLQAARASVLAALGATPKNLSTQHGVAA